MQKEEGIIVSILNLITWIVAILIVVVISTALIGNTLVVPFLVQKGQHVTGWFILILGILSIILTIIRRRLK